MSPTDWLDRERTRARRRIRYRTDLLRSRLHLTGMRMKPLAALGAIAAGTAVCVAFPKAVARGVRAGVSLAASTLAMRARSYVLTHMGSSGSSSSSSSSS